MCLFVIHIYSAVGGMIGYKIVILCFILFEAQHSSEIRNESRSGL